jgi:hypothetical protein
VFIPSTLWTAVAVPLISGLVLWFIQDWIRYGYWLSRSRKARRRRIVSLLGRAHSITFRAIRDRLYEEAFLTSSTKPLETVKREYDDITVAALDLFERGEEDVAFWTAVEFHAGFWDPLMFLEDREAPRIPDPKGWPLIPFEAEGESWLEDERGKRVESAGYILPRSHRLSGWAEGKDPGPRYGHMFRPGDTLRHNIVPPNSDLNMEMLLPPLWTGWGKRSRHPFRNEHWTWRLSCGKNA